ncbi:MAG: COX15/CtaA family protein [Verrucomicrobiae bacterium]|nr:COX15/CtaA family protein [Verrucomicrobiae bacterium]
MSPENFHSSWKASAIRRFHRFSIALAVMTVILIWWGAATTTKQAGMAFADWPLSLGSINPPGWLEHMVPFLEHSHRLLATTVGLMTLALFSWSFVRSGRDVVEVAAVVVWLAVTFGLFIAAGAERQDPQRKEWLFLFALSTSLVPVGWLVWSWKRRHWPLLVRLSALALLMVTGQAILGGVRVTEVSDTFAVIHGCLAQGFFCVIILIGMLSVPGWQERRSQLNEDWIPTAKLGSAAMVFAVVVQLIFGALMRHHHRSGLADTGIFLTGGSWFPGWSSEILLLMFAHKYWALFVFAQGVSLAGWLWSRGDLPRGLVRHGLAVAALLVLQLGLGVTVLLTGSPEHKRFWVTNFHVLNGLAILGASFGLAVRCWTATRKLTRLDDFTSPRPSLPQRRP